MTAREYLEQARQLQARIDACERELRRLRSLADGVQAVGFDSRVSVSAGTAPFVETVERIVTVEQAVSEQLNRLIALRGEIALTIAAVPDAQARDALAAYYLRRQSAGDIAAAAHVSVRTVWRRIERGVGLVERLRM